MINNELIKQARQANLAQYLLGVGVSLIRDGRRHKHCEHDSLVFTDNAYYRNSQQDHGNAVDYLVRHMGMDFKAAVLALTGSPIITHAPQSGKFKLAEPHHNQDRVAKYLGGTRSIGYGVINFLIENKLLFQETRTSNAVFPIYDESGSCVGTELQGTGAKRFKGIAAHSKYGCGFNVRFSDNGVFNYALFFESAVDLISFIDFKRNREKKTLNGCILISMSGLKTNIIKHCTSTFGGDCKVVLCVDNDTTGRSFKAKLTREGVAYIDQSPHENYKDRNEQLADSKKKGKVIEHHIKRKEFVLQ
jgi:hypothetical protein